MKPQPWFRMYNEVVDDPKVQRLSPILFKAWINFLCIAGKYGGVLPPVADVAYYLRITVIKAEYFLQELVKAQLMEWHEGVARPHNWHGRQYKSDSSTGRVQRFREVKGNVSETPEETHQRQSRTEQTDSAVADITPYTREFETMFWEHYPNKTGKGAAFKSWQKLKPSHLTQEKIRDGVLRDRASPKWQMENGRFIPNPTTYLNQRRWEDEPTKFKTARPTFTQ